MLGSPTFRGLVLGGMLAWTAACGVKGKPVPPERVIPRSPSEVRLEVVSEGVLIQCKVPRRNTDGSPLRDLEALEIWRADLALEDCPGCPSEFRKVGEVPYVYEVGTSVARGAARHLDEVNKPGLYRYRVNARSKRGILGRPSRRVEVYWDVPPREVEGVVADAGDEAVVLRWEPVMQRADGLALKEAVTYEVFRGVKGEGLGPKPIHESPVEETRFSDKGVENGITYQYGIRALRPIGNRRVPGPLSLPVEATPTDLTAPEPPKNLVGFPTENGIRLVWEGGEEPDISGYRVYRAPAPDGPWVLLTPEPSATVLFEDRNVVPGRDYWYTVTALDDATPPNESSRSEAAKARFGR